MSSNYIRAMRDNLIGHVNEERALKRLIDGKEMARAAIDTEIGILSHARMAMREVIDHYEEAIAEAIIREEQAARTAMAAPIDDGTEERP